MGHAGDIYDRIDLSAPRPSQYMANQSAVRALCDSEIIESVFATFGSKSPLVAFPSSSVYDPMCLTERLQQ